MIIDKDNYTELLCHVRRRILEQIRMYDCFTREDIGRQIRHLLLPAVLEWLGIENADIYTGQLEIDLLKSSYDMDGSQDFINLLFEKKGYYFSNTGKLEKIKTKEENINERIR